MDDETDTPVRLYIGINETKWNHHPVSPGKYTCVSPIYGRTERTKVKNSVFIPDGCVVLSDSGAFSDGPQSRLALRDAMDRQLSHAEQYRYTGRIDNFASYDLLIDEKWIDGKRHKRRWSESDAWAAVDETVTAARFVHKHRSYIPSSLVLSAQGVTVQQYVTCVERLASFSVRVMFSDWAVGVFWDKEDR